MGFRPLTLFGYTVGAAIALLCIIIVAGLGSFGAALHSEIGFPTPTSSLTPTLTATPTVTPSPVPPTATLTPTITPSPTLTPTQTPTPTATPIFAVVDLDSTEGARIRSEPGGETIGFLTNQTIVIILPDTQEIDGVLWVRIQGPGDLEGWIVQSLIEVVTPTPSSTP